MRDLIESRITELRAELEAGHRLLVDLETRQEELRRSMLRISGAIQVLAELSAADDKRSETLVEAPRETAADAPAPLRRVVEAVTVGGRHAR
jgi:prefoldin subunit 5